MDEDEVVEVDVDSSERKSSLRRRSSIANSVRRSRSIVGISFEDQIASLDPTTPVTDRLTQIFNLSLSATCRLLQVQADEADDDDMASMIDHVKTSLILKGPILNKEDPLIDKLAKKVDIMSGLIEEARTPLQNLPPRMKSLQEYQSQITRESDQWKDLHSSRKNRLNAARAHLRAVKNGEKVIDDACRAELPRAEEAALRAASDGRLELERLRQLTSKLIVERQHLNRQLAKRQRTLDELSSRVDEAAKLICRESGLVHNVDLRQPAPFPLQSMENELVETSK